MTSRFPWDVRSMANDVESMNATLARVVVEAPTHDHAEKDVDAKCMEKIGELHPSNQNMCVDVGLWQPCCTVGANSAYLKHNGTNGTLIFLDSCYSLSLKVFIANQWVVSNLISFMHACFSRNACC